MPAGRPSSYNQEIADAICESMVEKSLITVLSELKGRFLNAPSYTTVMRWLLTNEEFRANYARAREVSGDFDAEKIRQIQQQILVGEVEPNAGRVVIDSLKWIAGKRKPKVYGDKIEIDQTVTTKSEDIDYSVLDSSEVATLRDLLARAKAGKAEEPVSAVPSKANGAT